MDLVGPIREYIEARYSPEEAKAAEEDLETLALLRSEVVANTQTNEQRRETLLAYYRALSVVEGRFPVSKQGGHVNLPFTWTDAFNTRKSTTLASVRFEKAATLFNLGCTWSQRGCGADREDVEGIKTAAHAFQHAAGAFATLRDLADRAAGAGDEGPTPDLSKECASMLVALHLAQAQKCFFDKAAADGKSAGLLVKLAQQTHLFYEEMREALLAPPLSAHVDKSWLAHAESMSAMFHAEALSRAAKEADDDDETIGPKIARLSRASKTLTDAIKSAKGISGSSLVVIAALKVSRDAVDEDLRRATKDNECVYMVRVPAFEDLPPLGAAAVVKAIPPPPESLDSSGETLFSKIVPESGFKALSKYTEKVDALIRDENDVLALASDEARLALTEMELPELLVAAMATSASAVPPGGAGDAAAGRGAGLPSPLDADVASIQNAGGVSGLRNNLQRLHDMHEACAQQLDAAERMLDAEAKEDDACRCAFGPGNWTRPASADLSGNLRDKIASYRGNLAQAFRSDDSLRMRVADAAEGVLSLLDPVALAAATPALRAPMLSTAPDPVPALRAALEDLEAVGAERAGIEDMMRQLKENDNIMSKVMAKTGDDYETLFASEIAKYDRAREAVASNVSSQSDILSRLRDNHATFLEQYDVPAWRAAMASHAETVRAATAHHRELSSGVERGQTFYAGFAQAVAQLGADCEGFVENRRREKRELEQAVAQRAQQAATVAEHHAAATAAAQRAAADQAAAQRAVAEAQASMHATGAAAATAVGPAPPPGISTVADPFAAGAPSSYSQPPSPHQPQPPSPHQPQPGYFSQPSAPNPQGYGGYQAPSGAPPPQYQPHGAPPGPPSQAQYGHAPAQHPFPPPPPNGSHHYPTTPYGAPPGAGAPPPPPPSYGGGYR